ncbi:MAG: hypothetical protein RIS43_779 [Actinomycetota bacterium]
MRQLAGWDLAAWRMAKSDPTLRSTVVGIVELASVVPTDIILERIHAVVEREPALRSIIVDDDNGAVIKEINAIEVHRHIQIPERVMDVSGALSKFAEAEFDPDRPLWRTLIINTGQHTLLATAFHHAIADGQAAMMMLSQLLDNPPSLPQVEQPRSQERAEKSFKESARPVVDRMLKDPVGLTGDISRVVQSINSLLQVPLSAKAPARSPHFHFAAWEFDKRQTTLSIHDGVVAAAVDAWHSYTSHTSVVVNVPVAGYEVGGSNRFMIARLKLQASPHDPAHVAADSKDALKRWRNEPAAALLPQILNMAQYVPPAMLSTVLKQGEITVSTVRGANGEASIGGVAVQRVVPMVSPIGVALNITTAVLGDHVMIGITADGAVFPTRSAAISAVESGLLRVFGFLPARIIF